MEALTIPVCTRFAYQRSRRKTSVGRKCQRTRREQATLRTGKRRHVCELLDGGQKAADVTARHVLLQLLEHQLLQVLVHVEGAGNAHVGHKAHLYPARESKQ